MMIFKVMNLKNLLKLRMISKKQNNHYKYSQKKLNSF